MIPWFITQSSQLIKEKDMVAELEAGCDWLTNVSWYINDAIKLSVAFKLVLPHRSVMLVMTYHSTYPSSAPTIVPKNEERLSQHQYGLEDLCLQLRPDTWHPEYTGADSIKSAYELLSSEAPDEQGLVTTAPSAHHLADTIRTRSACCRFYIPQEFRTALLTLPPSKELAEMEAMWFFYGAERVVVHPISITQGQYCWKSRFYGSEICQEGTKRTIKLLTSTELTYTDITSIETTGQLETLLNGQFVFTKDFSELLLKLKDGNTVLYRDSGKCDQLTKYTNIEEPENTILCRTGNEHADHYQKQIGIIGLGSLGSKVATMLARAGFKQFVLIDDDIFHISNLERNELTWRDAGLPKVDAVKRQIHAICPEAEVVVRRSAIGAQVSTSEANNVDDLIGNCEIVIDATTNQNVFTHLCGIVSLSGAIFCWGGIYAGGIGGYIARSREGIDPHPHDIRNGFYQHYSQIDAKPPLPDTSTSYDGISEDEILIGADFHVTTIAGHLVSFAIDALSDNSANFNAHGYVIGFKHAWDFSGHFDVIPILIEAEIRQRQKDEAPNSTASEFLADLMVNWRNETANTD